MLPKPLQAYGSYIIFLAIHFINSGNLLVGQKTELQVPMDQTITAG